MLTPTLLLLHLFVRNDNEKLPVMDAMKELIDNLELNIRDAGDSESPPTKKVSFHEFEEWKDMSSLEILLDSEIEDYFKVKLSRAELQVKRPVCSKIQRTSRTCFQYL